MLNEMVN